MKYPKHSLLLLVLSGFLVGESWALPRCQGSYEQDTWTNCYGTFTATDGSKYVGEFKDDKYHGQGAYTWSPSGQEYVGEWKDNNMHGQGTFTWRPGGRVEEGMWEDGKFLYAQKISPKKGPVTIDKSQVIAVVKEERREGEVLGTIDGAIVGDAGEGAAIDALASTVFGALTRSVKGPEPPSEKSRSSIKESESNEIATNMPNTAENLTKSDAAATPSSNVSNTTQKLTKNSASPTPAKKKKQKRVFDQQKYLADLVQKTKDSIPSDANDAREKKAWINASRTLCASKEFNAFGPKKDWIGHVDIVRMDDDGTIDFKVEIEHGNDLIDYDINKKFEDIVLDLKTNKLFGGKGDKVKVSGRFKKGDMEGDNECLDGGLTDTPKLKNILFQFEFTDIQKIQ